MYTIYTKYIVVVAHRPAARSRSDLPTSLFLAKLPRTQGTYSTFSSTFQSQVYGQNQGRVEAREGGGDGWGGKVRWE